MNDRVQVRCEKRAARQNLSQPQQQSNARAICQRLCRQYFFQKSYQVGFYWASDGEVDLATTGLCKEKLSQEKQWYLPVVNHKRAKEGKLLFQPLPDSGQLVKNQFGILEPSYKPQACAYVTLLDLLLIPLVAFDRQGNRLGMGGGYYDRTIAAVKGSDKPTLVGIAHAVQEATFAVKEWDIPLQIIITEREIIHCSSGTA